jgi:AcrR family transcriptional regulator
MARTRAAVLRGARECVLRDGTRKTTMVQIAQVAGVAKATLYNHFRAKEEVFAALVESEVADAAAELRELRSVAGPHAALVRAAERLGTHPVTRRLAESEPGTLARLVIPGAEPAAPWGIAREAVAEVLGDDAPAATVELALRWLTSQLLWPSAREDLEASAAILLADQRGGPGGSSAEGGRLGFPRVGERVPGVLTEVH